MVDPHRDHALSDGKSGNAYSVSRLLTGLAIGGAVIGGGIILAPHILPALSVGSAEMAQEAMFVLHGSADAGGTGLAGAINSALSGIPLIGGKLAEGGLFNAVASGIIGIGGLFLGRAISKKECGKEGFKWGKLVKYAALVTSAIIALPTVLTALGTGLIYLATLGGNVEVANGAINLVDQTVGTAGNMTNTLMGFTGAAAAIPHLFTCGVSIVPPALAATLPDPGFAERVKTEEKQQPYSDGSIHAEMQCDAPSHVGKPVRAKLRLTHADNSAPLTPDELAVTHTEKLHLLLVDSSLQDYHHIHPKPAREPGVYEFSFTPATSNAYSTWVDFTLLGDDRNHRIKTDVTAGRNIPPRVRLSSSVISDGLMFDWLSDEPLRSGQPSIVEVKISDQAGRPVRDLEPVMGEYAHLVGFSADGESLIHAHPLDDSGRLRFHVEPDSSGPAQFYLQIRRQGKDMYIPFGQLIKSPDLASARLPAAHAGHAAHRA